MPRNDNAQLDARNFGPLTLAQIHRLLRPLRNKINSLAAILQKGERNASKTTTVRCEDDDYARKRASYNVKYGSKSLRSGSSTLNATFNSKTGGFPPLSLLPHPSRLQNSGYVANFTSWDLTSLAHGVGILELSRGVHAVVEAFKNVVSRAYGDEYLKRPDGVRSLMEIAVSIVGGDIEASVLELLRQESETSDEDEDETGDEDDEDEDDETSVIDGCYEQIPEHLRRWAIVPHAVKMILIHVPVKIPSLWEACLDVTIEYGARHDSISFLHQILGYALSSRGSRHLDSVSSNYLVNLLRKPNAPSKPLTQMWSETSYVDYVLNVLRELDSKTAETAWCTLGMRNLWTNLGGEFQALLELTLGFASVEFKTQKALKQLQLWIEDLLNRSVTLQPANSGAPVEGLYRLASLLEEKASSDKDDNNYQVGILSSLAVCVASRALMLASTSSSCYEDIKTLLYRSSSAGPTTFSTLLSSFATRQDEQGTRDPSPDVTLVLSLADAFRRYDIPRLEAALLAGALSATEQARDSDFMDQDLIEESIEMLETRLSTAEKSRTCNTWKWDGHWGWTLPTPARPSSQHAKPVSQPAAPLKRLASERQSDHYQADSSDESSHSEGTRVHRTQRSWKRPRISSPWGQKIRVLSPDSESSDAEPTTTASPSPSEPPPERSRSTSYHEVKSYHKSVSNTAPSRSRAPSTSSRISQQHNYQPRSRSGSHSNIIIHRLAASIMPNQKSLSSVSSTSSSHHKRRAGSQTASLQSRGRSIPATRTAPEAKNATFTGYPLRTPKNVGSSERDELDLFQISSSPKVIKMIR